MCMGWMVETLHIATFTILFRGRRERFLTQNGQPQFLNFIIEWNTSICTSGQAFAEDVPPIYIVVRTTFHGVV